MLSKAKLKWIHSFEDKKVRQETGLFLAEGCKLVGDLLPLLRCRMLVCTLEWEIPAALPEGIEVLVIDHFLFEKTSLLKHPQAVLGLFEQPGTHLQPSDLKGSLSLALDTVQDPGNLGTILRIADWFGIRCVVCSPDTVDAYNPKVVQATMGAIGRINVIYKDLTTFLPATGLPIYGTFLEGTPIQSLQPPTEGIIVMGNEGNGISPAVASLVTQKVLIPDYPRGATGSESLNVAVATAIVCHEFRRGLQG